MTVSERASSQNRRPCGYRTAPRLYTLPLALLNMEYSSVGQVNFGYLEAGAVIAMIPCVVLYIALQRYYIRGLTSGVVKG